MKLELMKKLLLLLLTLACIFTFCSCSKTATGIERYEDDKKELNSYAPDFLPDLNTLGDYNDIEYTFKNSYDSMFETHGYALFVSYDSDDYENQVEKIGEKYTFLSEDNTSHYPKLPISAFKYDGYDLKIVPLEYGESSCKYFGMIGLNKDNHYICYLMFANQDLDYIEIKGSAEETYIEMLEDYFKFI